MNALKGFALARMIISLSPFPLLSWWRVFRHWCARRATDGADITQLQIHDLHLDLLARRVFRAGTRLELTAKEFSLLSLLARHQGEILSKMMIAEQIWDMNFDSDANVVEVAIKRLRAKVDAPFDIKLLHTVRGMGYVLEVRSE
ncbi:DNA-binding heavy metal response regulator [Klebsiella michiganensis]|nr:DNA-binding heavy metal response regulator [Klebsiella michiganensis]